MKPYGGFRDRISCPIHGGGCSAFWKLGHWKEAVRKATRKFARQFSKKEINTQVADADKK